MSLVIFEKRLEAFLQYSAQIGVKVGYEDSISLQGVEYAFSRQD
jgi:hypothetical protein